MTSNVYIIAEAGVNHNGKLELAKQLIDVAVEAGASAVKFQTFTAALLATNSAKKAAYQQQNDPRMESQSQMLARLELKKEYHFILKEYCKAQNIDFMSSAFGIEDADFLIEQLNEPVIKLGSGELTNAPLLLYIARKNCRVILSTGMADLEEVRAALGVLAFGYLKKENPSSTQFDVALEKGLLKKNVTLLHCTSDYPCPPKYVNLRAMETLQKTFGLEVGFSDHSEGIEMAIAATALGASVIEKHFTLDKHLPGPDHKASLEPQELKQMISAIRKIEEALGSGRKFPAPQELATAMIVRKSLVAKKEIAKGELLTPENMTTSRTGEPGISPYRYWDFLSQPAARHYAKGEMIEEI